MSIEKKDTIFHNKTVLLALDMTYMDTLLIRYLAFLRDKIGIEHIYFYHNIWFNNEENGAAILSKLSRPLEDILADKIEKLAEGHFDKGDYEIIVTKSKDSAQEINRIQEIKKIDLSIFGKKVSVNDSGYLIERILYNKSASDLLIVPETAFYRLENVLVPIDFSRKSAKALLKSISLTERIKARISCLHVFAIANIYFPYLPIKDLKEQTQEKAKEEWKKYKAKYLQDSEVPEISFSFHADMSVSRVIYERALKEETDIIALPADASIINSKLISLLKMDMHLPLLILN